MMTVNFQKSSTVSHNTGKEEKPIHRMEMPRRDFDTQTKVERAVANNFALNSLNGANGFIINGVNGNADLGRAISSGDINGDGIQDLITSAPSPFFNFVYVIFGTRNPFSALFNLNALNGQNGFMITNRIPGSGITLATGDFNGDGVDDIVYQGSFNQAVVAFGSKQGFPANVNFITQDPNGSNGMIITGSGSGFGLATGDLNNDGTTDIFISGSNGNIGKVFVVFGQKTAFPATLNLANLNGANGFVANGNPNDGTGASLASRDFNGDGIADLAIGAPDAATTYVLYGSTTPFPSSVNLSSLNGNNGFTAQSTISFDKTGTSLSIGDVNKDGKNDLIIGAPSGGNNAGAVYTVFGKGTNFPSNVNISSLIDGTQGFEIKGVNPLDLTGQSVATGDVNDDGIPDILIGAPNAPREGANNGPGIAYVVFGKETGFPPSLNLGTLAINDGFAAHGIKSGDNTGVSIFSADINGDGKPDLFVGANFAGPTFPNNQFPGSAYILFGGQGIANNNSTNNPVASSASKRENYFSYLTTFIDLTWVTMKLLTNRLPNQDLKQDFPSLNKSKISDVNHLMPQMIEPTLVLGTFAIAVLFNSRNKKVKQEDSVFEEPLKDHTVKVMKKKLNDELFSLRRISQDLFSNPKVSPSTKKTLNFLMQDLQEDIEDFRFGRTTRSHLNNAFQDKRYIQEEIQKQMLLKKIV